MSNALYKRTYRLVIANLEITELDIEFNIKKDEKESLNELNLVVHGINHERWTNSIKTGAKVELYVGYADFNGLIFKGEIKQLIVDNQKAMVKAYEGLNVYSKTWINLVLNKNWNDKLLLEKLAEKVQLRVGLVELENGWRDFEFSQPRAKSVFCYFRDAMRDLARKYNCNWYISNDTLNLVKIGKKNLATSLILLDKTSGLVETPSRDENGLIVVKTLLFYSFKVNSKVALESSRFKGTFIIKEITTEGTTDPNGKWQHTLKLLKV